MVSHIKIIVKQLTGHIQLGLNNLEAGALTESTVKAAKRICDSVIGQNSQLTHRTDKILGSSYIRTSTVLDTKHQVVTSTGKHTNAVLSCLEWMKHNLPDFVEKRREFVNEHEKALFFAALQKLANSSENRLEMLEMSEHVKEKLASIHMMDRIHQDRYFGRNIADLILISMSKNQLHVKSIAANSRKGTAGKTTVFSKESAAGENTESSDR